MSLKIVMTKGLPASGKSTWAKKHVSENARWKRVNMDDLRSMLDNGVWTKSNEKFIQRVREDLVDKVLSEGYSVVIDDTNLHPKHEAMARKMAEAFEAEFEIRDFTDVPVEECILRDAARGEKRVGPEVIREMYHKYLAYGHQHIKKRSQDPALPKAFISDLDGTLALINGRDPYDGTKCSSDLPNEPVIAVYKALQAAGYKAVILSGRCTGPPGREAAAMDATLQWLEEHGISFDYFEMRPTGDSRRDCILKKEMLERVEKHYNIHLVLDDRKQVVDMWREQGIPCLQVAPGDF